MYFNVKTAFLSFFHPVGGEIGFIKIKFRLTDMMLHLDLAQAQLELLAL